MIGFEPADPVPPGHGEPTKVGATPEPTRECPGCLGLGKYSAQICPLCDGAGTVPKAMLDAYDWGVIDGMKRYAWWKDGSQWVGTTGTLLSTACRHYLEEVSDRPVPQH